jgi:hypothetical protein
MSDLKPLRSSLGQPAEGEDKFFQRDTIVKKIFRQLDNGENLLLSAPRRIGKSSILKYIQQHPKADQIIKYIIVQSVTSEEEFFKKLYNELLNDKEIFAGVRGYFTRSTAAVQKYASRITGFSVLDGSVEVGQHETINYYEECIKLIQSFETEKKIIIFIDEFPDTINNMLEKSEELALNFLQKNRDLRMQFSGKNLQFVYTGSTGLKNVVRKLNKLDLVNDIATIQILPFSEKEANELIQRLILGFQEENEEFQLLEGTTEYIIDKIRWRLPYYIQIIIEELFDYFEENLNAIDNTTVDFVLSEIVKSNSKHSDYFENWKGRLKTAFKNNDYEFAIDVLNFIAKNDSIEYAVFIDLAIKHGIEDHKYILDVLEHDGYISEDNKTYGFNSILLKEWWFINVAT